MGEYVLVLTIFWTTATGAVDRDRTETFIHAKPSLEACERSRTAALAAAVKTDAQFLATCRVRRPGDVLSRVGSWESAPRRDPAVETEI